MNEIYNFIRLNNKLQSDLVIFITEINTNVSNKKLYSQGHALYKHLHQNKFIPINAYVIISFIKHFSKSVKNMLICENKKITSIRNKININKIIVEYININKNKEKLDNYIVYEKNQGNYNIHHLKKKYCLKKHKKYYIN